ncbi:hypothetical protein Trydic_g7111 [Trypoxylus dichotomus]
MQKYANPAESSSRRAATRQKGGGRGSAVFPFGTFFCTTTVPGVEVGVAARSLGALRHRPSLPSRRSPHARLPKGNVDRVGGARRVIMRGRMEKRPRGVHV